MSSTRKFMVFGPSDTLERMSKAVLDATTPQYHFQSPSQTDGNVIHVLVYEEHQKLMNSSVSVTLLLAFMGTSVRADVVTTGGRMGFRGSTPEGDVPLNDAIIDTILDFGKRFGLTIQELNDKTKNEA